MAPRPLSAPNRWESTFGAECSSILFELPHFALELLVVLPLVQVIAGRLRIVGQPAHVGGPSGAAARRSWRYGARRAAVRVDARSGATPVPARARANSRMMAMILLVTGLAGFNALVVPVALERLTLGDPRSAAVLEFGPELTAVVEAGRSAELEGKEPAAKDGPGGAEEKGVVYRSGLVKTLKLRVESPGWPDGGGRAPPEMLMIPRHWFPELDAKSKFLLGGQSPTQGVVAVCSTPALALYSNRYRLRFLADTTGLDISASALSSSPPTTPIFRPTSSPPPPRPLLSISLPSGSTTSRCERRRQWRQRTGCTR